MSEHQPWLQDPVTDPQAKPPRDDDERGDALEDLDVGEDAEHVAGGHCGSVWDEEGQPQIE